MAGADVIRGWAEDVRRFADDWPRQGGEVLERAITDQLRADTGGDSRLSHSQNGAAEVRVIPGRETVVEAAGDMRTWAILESGTSAHTVTGHGARGVLNTPYGPRRSVTVSGSPGKSTWSRGMDAGMPEVEASAEQEWSKVSG